MGEVGRLLTGSVAAAPDRGRRGRERRDEPRPAAAHLAPGPRFPFLEPPLKTVLAGRARSLNAVLARSAAEAEAHFVELDTELDEPFFSSDRFHPSARGYGIWAGALVEPIAAPVRAS